VASKIADRWSEKKNGDDSDRSQPAGLLAIADALNPAAAVKRLRELNVPMVMLTDKVPRVFWRKRL
jgi:hypothetical protein